MGGPCRTRGACENNMIRRWPARSHSQGGGPNTEWRTEWLTQSANIKWGQHAPERLARRESGKGRRVKSVWGPGAYSYVPPSTILDRMVSDVSVRVPVKENPGLCTLGDSTGREDVVTSDSHRSAVRDAPSPPPPHKPAKGCISQSRVALRHSSFVVRSSRTDRLSEAWDTLRQPWFCERKEFDDR